MSSTASADESGQARWTVLRGPITAEQILILTDLLAQQRGLTSSRGNRGVTLTDPTGQETAVTVRWKALPPQPPRTQGHQIPAPPALEILIDPARGDSTQLVRELRKHLTAAALPYSATELDGITAAMPLLHRFSAPTSVFDDWALLFRDHYLEHSVGFLLAMEHAGVPAEWIYALDKGDRTWNRDRVHATFVARGYRSGLLDNTALNAAASHAADLDQASADINEFIDAAHTAGRRVLVVDDGGLLARGYGSAGARPQADAALELTVSGIKRIAAAGPLTIPVLNMARSQVKVLLGYREIADSCLRRMRTILPGHKFIGRRVLLLGYGTLGSHLAPALRTLGCRVDVVDTDLPTLITAAEAGYATYRSAGEALRANEPFLVVGTTGEIALTEPDLQLLTDGVFLAPFATRDFSILTEQTAAPAPTQIPGVGLRFRLGPGRTATLLGDGRSMNLFEADSIPSQGYDAYRAGTFIAARYLCADPGAVPAGLHTAPADAAITRAGLFEAYYDLYTDQHPGLGQTAQPSRVREHLTNACVVGYGNAGRLHTVILAELGARVTIIDPKHQHLPSGHRTFRREVSELPAHLAADIDVWSICCPTADHLPVLTAVLAHNPAARVLLEKPACQGNEIDDFTALLARHPDARVIVNDQYRHSTVLPACSRLVSRHEPDAPISKVTVTFTKDRTADMATGRFIDRDYGVLGYEWLHMLTVLAGVLPAPLMDSYLTGDVASSELWANFDPRLFIAALTERTTLREYPSGPVHLELASSILDSSVPLGHPPTPRPPWRQDIRPADNRHRHLTVQAGATHFALHLEPVTAHDGWQLDRNHHRLTATRGGHLLHDEVLRDSPMESSVQRAVATLLADTPLPHPDLAPLRRIAALAGTLRSKNPQRSRLTAS